MILTTTDTLTPDTDHGEGGAILEKKLPERNPLPLFGLGMILFRQIQYGIFSVRNYDPSDAGDCPGCRPRCVGRHQRDGKI